MFAREWWLHADRQSKIEYISICVDDCTLGCGVRAALVQVELKVHHFWWQQWDTILCREYHALQSHRHCMTTRSGRAYKSTVKTMDELKKMMAELVADRQKRDEEFAAERQRREVEAVSERTRREREVERTMETMQSHIDNLMSMVKAQLVAESGVELSVKLVVLKDDDDIELYLITFERIMATHKVEKERWPHYLALQLAGKAQLAFTALSIMEVGEYEAIKEAILTRYNINEEAYRNRFRTEKGSRQSCRQGGESCCRRGERVLPRMLILSSTRLATNELLLERGNGV